MGCSKEGDVGSFFGEVAFEQRLRVGKGWLGGGCGKNMPDQGCPIHLPLWVKEEGLLRAPLCVFFDIGLCDLLGLGNKIPAGAPRACKGSGKYSVKRNECIQSSISKLNLNFLEMPAI